MSKVDRAIPESTSSNFNLVSALRLGIVYVANVVNVDNVVNVVNVANVVNVVNVVKVVNVAIEMTLPPSVLLL